MAIKLQGTGGSIKLQGTGGSIKMQSSGGGGGGGGGGPAVYWTYPDFMTGNNVSVPVNPGDEVAFQNFFAMSNSLTSTYASQAYTISTSDSSFNAVSQIASGNVPLNLGDIYFSDYYGSTYSNTNPELPGFTMYNFIAVVSGISFKIVVAVMSGGGGFGGGGGGGGGW